MARRMLIQHDGSPTFLTETLADNESQLQELLKTNPELLPIEEWNMTGPLMVVGRGTSLPSGSVDLVAVSKDGSILIVEFKTGPQNTDFRHALAQLLDYGSHLWNMTFAEFEDTVALRYFSSPACEDVKLKGKTSLAGAATGVWPEFTEDDRSAFEDRITQQLKNGAFHFILAAQRFTSTISRTISYLNSTVSGARFYAVEVVRFSGNMISAFESKTITKPDSRAIGLKQDTNESQFLDRIQDSSYAAVLREILEFCHNNGFHFKWGTKGTAIKLNTLDRKEPLSVAWLFPPGVPGWYGLTDFTLGFDEWSADQAPSARPALDAYLKRLAGISGVVPLTKKTIRGYRIPPNVLVDRHGEVAEVLAGLIGEIGAMV